MKNIQKLASVKSRNISKQKRLNDLGILIADFFHSKNNNTDAIIAYADINPSKMMAHCCDETLQRAKRDYQLLIELSAKQVFEKHSLLKYDFNDRNFKS